MKIREANLTDAEFLIQLRFENALYHADLVSNGLLNDDAYEFLNKHTMESLNDKYGKILVLENNGRLVGYVMGFINQLHPVLHLGTQGLIDDFYISPDFQGKGNGTTLLNELMSWFKFHHIETISLNVYANNLAGQSFWKKHDFKVQSNRLYKHIKPAI